MIFKSQTIKTIENMKLSKGVITLLVILGFVLILFFWIKGAYNGMVSKEEQVTSAWSQVENVYQRRADLIPNLVATVKGYAAHEKETLEGVINARSKATQTTVNPTKMNEESIKKFQAAQGTLNAESIQDVRSNNN